MSPLLFQDDISNVSDTIEEAQKANNKMEDLLERKLLSLNLDKSKFLVVGSNKARRKMIEKLEETPLMLGKSRMGMASEEKYLGVWLSCTVSDSIAATVSHRLGLATRAIHEIRTVIEDVRADSIGAVEVGLTLWNQSVMPAVLYGFEVMFNIPKKTMKQLTDLNNRALKAIMGVGKNGVPLPALYLELACWTIPNQVLYRQIMFTHHVATLSTGTLGRNFFELQQSRNLYDSVIIPCLEILREWNISNIQSYSKLQFICVIIKLISAKNSKDLFDWGRSYKKINLHKYEEELKMQEYVKKLSLAKARLIFRKNCGFLNTVRMNFKNNKKYKSERYLCPDCTNLNPTITHIDSQDLLTKCEGNKDLRSDLNLNDTSQLAEYLKRVIERRIQRDEG